MCGIVGAIIRRPGDELYELLKSSEIRGQDGTGVALLRNGAFDVYRSRLKVSEWLSVDGYPTLLEENDLVIGQNRLAVFGLSSENDQPIISSDLAIVHNGNLFGFEEQFQQLGLQRKYEVDTELLLRIVESMGFEEGVDFIFNNVKGDFACLMINRKSNSIVAFRRYKPLWYVENDIGLFFFSTEQIGRKVFPDGDFQEVESGRLITKTI